MRRRLAVLARVYRSLDTPDYPGLCRCLAHLNDSAAVAQILNTLLEGARLDDVLSRLDGALGAAVKSWPQELYRQQHRSVLESLDLVLEVYRDKG